MEHFSLEDRVYKVLLRKITDREFIPGQKLVEANIANELGVSRTPVRAALHLLEARKYITRFPYRGYIVANQTKLNVRNIYEVREALEMMSLKLACERATEQHIRKAEECLQKLSAAVDTHNVEEFIKLNTELHKIMSRGCGNEIIISMLDEVWGPNYSIIDKIVIDIINDKEWVHFKRTHEKMVEALKERNQEKMTRAVEEHWEENMNTYERIQ